VSEETARAPWTLSPDQLFELARRLYGSVEDLPLVCPAKRAYRTGDA
jgi:hypothetical protein